MSKEEDRVGLGNENEDESSKMKDESLKNEKGFFIRGGL